MGTDRQSIRLCHWAVCQPSDALLGGDRVVDSARSDPTEGVPGGRNRGGTDRAALCRRKGVGRVECCRPGPSSFRDSGPVLHSLAVAFTSLVGRIDSDPPSCGKEDRGTAEAFGGNQVNDRLEGTGLGELFPPRGARSTRGSHGACCAGADGLGIAGRSWPDGQTDPGSWRWSNGHQPTPRASNSAPSFPYASERGPDTSSHSDTEQSPFSTVNQFWVRLPTISSKTVEPSRGRPLFDQSGAEVATGNTGGHPCDAPDATLQNFKLAFSGTAAASVRRVTRSLLRAMLPDAAPDDAFERLQALPFVYSGSDGLIVHDAVRDAIAGHLRATDPTTYRELRLAEVLWQHHRLSGLKLGDVVADAKYGTSVNFLYLGRLSLRAFIPLTRFGVMRKDIWGREHFQW